MKWPKPNQIYFLATGDRSMIRIGASSDPLHRFCKIKGTSPVRVDFLTSTEGSYPDEVFLHYSFWEHHSHCEWFHSHPDIWAAIYHVAVTGKLPDHLIRPANLKLPKFKWGPGFASEAAA